MFVALIASQVQAMVDFVSHSCIALSCEPFSCCFSFGIEPPEISSGNFGRALAVLSSAIVNTQNDAVGRQVCSARMVPAQSRSQRLSESLIERLPSAVGSFFQHEDCI